MELRPCATSAPSPSELVMTSSPARETPMLGAFRRMVRATKQRI